MNGLYKAVELAHGALKQNVIFQKLLHYTYLLPIGDSLGEKYNITEKARQLAKEVILYSVAIEVYNRFRPKAIIPCLCSDFFFLYMAVILVIKIKVPVR